MCEYCDDVCKLNWKYGLDHILPDYRYCPMCGQCLTHEEPLTLEELKQMDGEPVWIESNLGNEHSGWMLSADSQDYIDYVVEVGGQLYRHKPIEEGQT